jgi:hypothetical protein
MIPLAIAFCGQMTYGYYSEARVRYILADMSLGSPTSCYSGFRRDGNAIEALRRWDGGVKVVNLGMFEKYMEDGGPVIVYRGTRKVIKGMDVRLSTDVPYREARVRYIMADISLGRAISYYQRFPSDSNVVEALKRWDKGVRVLNRGDFERRVEDGGPLVEYAGVQGVIDGMDVKLSSDAAYDEARVRYILTDLSLGGPATYYQKFPRDPNVVEALRRWDIGARVTNSDKFERPVEEGGPGVVYKGTASVIDGMDARLSSDASYDEARVRYILADLSLGGAMTYYRKFPEDLDAAEALRRLDSGVIVTNSSKFERHVEKDGPIVVYKGANSVIKGMDVRLSSDVSYDEARVRYVLADMSLGGPIKYYREFSEDPDAAEALRRWDDGVRVTNSSKFERQGEECGPGVVYQGTDSLVDGMDVKLSSDR